MQLDVDVSPPAAIISLRLTLTHVTFDLDPCDLWPRPMWSLIQDCKMRPETMFLTWWPLTYAIGHWSWPLKSTWGSSISMFWQNFINLDAIQFEIWILVQQFLVQSQIDKQTDRKWCIWVHCAYTQVGLKILLYNRGLYPFLNPHPHIKFCLALKWCLPVPHAESGLFVSGSLHCIWSGGCKGLCMGLGSIKLWPGAPFGQGCCCFTGHVLAAFGSCNEWTCS